MGEVPWDRACLDCQDHEMVGEVLGADRGLQGDMPAVGGDWDGEERRVELLGTVSVA